MITIPNVKELNKILRTQLITQSEIPQKKVLNAISKYGENLEKNISEQIFDSYDINDVVLLFELQSRNNQNDVSMTDEFDVITYYKSYNLHVILYGATSSDVANKIVARFRTQYVRNSLQNSGVYIENLSEPIMINEFVNGVIWPRTDFDIEISTKFSIIQKTIEPDFQNFIPVQIIKK